MVQERNIAVCVILSIVTLGIYGIYWMIVLANDVNTVSENPNGTSGVIVFLLSLVTCGIYYWYWSYQAGGKLYEAKQQKGIGGDNMAVVYLILCVVGLSIVTECLIQNERNKLAAPTAQ